MGFRFFDMEISDLGEPYPKHRDDAASSVQVTYKYIPYGYGPGADTSVDRQRLVEVLEGVGVCREGPLGALRPR